MAKLINKNSRILIVGDYQGHLFQSVKNDYNFKYCTSKEGGYENISSLVSIELNLNNYDALLVFALNKELYEKALPDLDFPQRYVYQKQKQKLLQSNTKFSPESISEKMINDQKCWKQMQKNLKIIWVIPPIPDCVRYSKQVFRWDFNAEQIENLVCHESIMAEKIQNLFTQIRKKRMLFFLLRNIIQQEVIGNGKDIPYRVTHNDHWTTNGLNIQMEVGKLIIEKVFETFGGKIGGSAIADQNFAPAKEDSDDDIEIIGEQPATMPIRQNENDWQYPDAPRAPTPPRISSMSMPPNDHRSRSPHRHRSRSRSSSRSRGRDGHSSNRDDNYRSRSDQNSKDEKSWPNRYNDSRNDKSRQGRDPKTGSWNDRSFPGRDSRIDKTLHKRDPKEHRSLPDRSWNDMSWLNQDPNKNSGNDIAHHNRDSNGNRPWANHGPTNDVPLLDSRNDQVWPALPAAGNEKFWPDHNPTNDKVWPAQNHMNESAWPAPNPDLRNDKFWPDPNPDPIKDKLDISTDFWDSSSRPDNSAGGPNSSDIFDYLEKKHFRGNDVKDEPPEVNEQMDTLETSQSFYREFMSSLVEEPRSSDTRKSKEKLITKAKSASTTNAEVDLKTNPVSKLLLKLSDSTINSNEESEFALDIMISLCRSLINFNHFKSKPKITTLLLESELKIRTIKSMEDEEREKEKEEKRAQEKAVVKRAAPNDILKSKAPGVTLNNSVLKDLVDSVQTGKESQTKYNPFDRQGAQGRFPPQSLSSTGVPPPTTNQTRGNLTYPSLSTLQDPPPSFPPPSFPPPPRNNWAQPPAPVAPVAPSFNPKPSQPRWTDPSQQKGGAGLLETLSMQPTEFMENDYAPRGRGRSARERIMPTPAAGDYNFAGPRRSRGPNRGRGGNNAYRYT